MDCKLNKIIFNFLPSPPSSGNYKNIMEMPPYKLLLTNEYKTFMQKFGIVSFIIPNNLKVTTYTEKNFNGMLGGPYTGPLHIPQANWDTIWSLKIESLLANADDDDSEESEDDSGKKSDEQKNSGKEEGNSKENINPEYMNIDSGKEEEGLLKDKINLEMMNNSGQHDKETGKETPVTEENKEMSGKEGGNRKEIINNEASQMMSAVDMYLAKGNMASHLYSILRSHMLHFFIKIFLI